MPPQYIFTIEKLSKAYARRKCSRISGCRFIREPRSASSAAMARAKARCCGSWPGSINDFVGTARPAPGSRSAMCPRSRCSTRRSTFAATSSRPSAAVRHLLNRFDEINARLGEGPKRDEMDALLDEQASVQDAIEAADGWDLDRRIEIAMDAMRLPPGDADVSTLSGGERRRVALCKVLLERPDILLLDEPTNHLDAESVAWLERHLSDYPGTVIPVTHDRYFLDNVAKWILELDRGQGIPWEGNYSSWLEQKQARLALEEKQESSRRKHLARELEWVRMSPRAREAKNRARISATSSLPARSTRSATRRSCSRSRPARIWAIAGRRGRKRG